MPAKPTARRPLYAFFDLQVSPIGYDFITFLVMAEIARRETASDVIHMVVVPAAGSGFRNDPNQDSNFDLEQKHWRISNIVLPACALMPTCTSYHVCPDRTEAQRLFDAVEQRGVAIYPESYRIETPTMGWQSKRPICAAALGKEIPSLSATPLALAYVTQWLDARAPAARVVSITLREAEWHDDRNSNVGAWCAFADWLRGAGYVPVFVRDTSKAFVRPTREIERFLSFDVAAVDMEIRLALYESCYLNLLVSNGPAELAMFDDAVRFLMYKAVPPAAYRLNAHPQGASGLHTGDDLPFGTPYQRWIWEPDEFGVLKREFEAMAAAIDRSDGKAFRRLGLKRPIDPPRQLAMAHLYRNYRQAPEARALYDVFRDSLSNRAEYLIWRCDVEVIERNYVDARAYASRAISLDPLNAANQIKLGDTSLHTVDIDAAEVAYTTALELGGHEFDASVRLGLCSQLREDYDVAAGWFERALALRPGDRFVLEKLAQVAKEAGKLDRAVELWMKTRAATKS